jgi:phage shock protein E
VKTTAWIAAAVVTATVLAGCSNSAAIEDVDVPQAATILDQGEAIILDVRTPQEYASGHLPGAINIDVEASDFADRVSGLDEAAETLVYCQTGNRSGVATDQMADLGFSDLADLQGGIEAWSAAGEPVTQ